MKKILIRNIIFGLKCSIINTIIFTIMFVLFHFKFINLYSGVLAGCISFVISFMIDVMNRIIIRRNITDEDVEYFMDELNNNGGRMSNEKFLKMWGIEKTNEIIEICEERFGYTITKIKKE